ncbi:MAG: hypothetical protein AABY22_30810 [Nanoarchaeota archaeon]
MGNIEFKETEKGTKYKYVKVKEIKFTNPYTDYVYFHSEQDLIDEVTSTFNDAETEWTQIHGRTFLSDGKKLVVGLVI